MPSIKMKNKLNRGSIGGKSGLHVCQKSNIISKNLNSPFRALHAAEFENCTQNSQDVYSSIQVSPDSSRNAISGDTVDYQDWLDGENFQLQPQTPYFVDPTIMGRMISDWQDFAPASSPNLGTIFSPALKSDELHGELNVFTAADIKNEADLPQLRSDDSDDNSGESCDYTTCSTSDFSISDMIVADLPFDGNTMHDKRINTSFFPGFKCPEQYVILPFSEDAVGASDIDEAKLSEVIVDSDESSLYLAIEQLRPENQECDINYTAFDNAECFDSHLLNQDIPDLLDAVWSTVLPKKTLRKHITLVLDLDETLVHSTLDHCDDADFSFPVFFNSKEHTVYVKQRPYLHRFLERVAEMFEIIVFTASQSIYAKQLLDTLDPDGKLISRRAYRESCIFSDGSYTKDLTVLGVDLAKVAIIDNSPQVFRLQVNNGIPIKSWFDDQSDNALISLLPFLENLAGADDVRPLIAKKFGNKE